MLRGSGIIPVLALLIALAAAVPAAPQSPEVPAEPARGGFGESIEVRVVNVDVFVTDRHGARVSGLTRDDFILEVDGKPVPISNFYAEVAGRPVPAATTAAAVPPVAAAPPGGTVPLEQRMRVALVIDHSRLSAANRRRVLNALRGFLRERLQPEDAVTVIGLAGSLDMHADFLNDPATVERILDRISNTSARSSILETERRRTFDLLARGGSGGFAAAAADEVISAQEVLVRIRAYAEGEYQRARNTLRSLEAVIATLGGVPGRKALVYVGEGIVNQPGEDLFTVWMRRYGEGNPGALRGTPRVDFNLDYAQSVGRFDLLPDFQRLGRRANAAGVTLYAIDAESDHGSIARGAQVEAGASSEVISLIEANARAPLELLTEATGGQRIQASSRLRAELDRMADDFDTYYSLGFTPAAGEEVDQGRIRVRVERDGFSVRHRSSFRTAAPDERAAEATLATLFYNAGDNPLGVSLEAQPRERRQDGASVLPLRVAIPLARVGLVPDGDSYRASLALYVSVKDAAGDARPVQRLPFHLAIPAERLTEATADTAHTLLPLILRPGDQQVAVGVRDELGTVTSTVRLELADE